MPGFPLPLAVTLFVATGLAPSVAPGSTVSTEPVTSAPNDAIPGEYLAGPDMDLAARPGTVVLRELGAGWRLVATGPPTRVHATPHDTGATGSAGPDADLVPNMLLEPADDPRFRDQWALRNTGQTGGTAGADIDVRAAWSVTRGDPSVVVAVLDSGIDGGHADLASRLWRNPGEVPGNGIDDDGNGYVDDTAGWDFINDDPDPEDGTGHGTSVAGILAAPANGVGIVGVAPGVTLMPLRVCTAVCPLSAIVGALSYAADNGADIVNLSFTGTGPFFQPIADVLAGEGSGLLAVAAVGNESTDIDHEPRYPASFDLPNMVAVAATDHDDALAGFSNHGRDTVHLAAPGDSVLSTARGGGYRMSTGTSYSVPHVAGVAALIASIRPELGPRRLIELLKAGAVPRPGLGGATRWGGRLDAGLSVTAAEAAESGFTDTAGSVFAVDIIWLSKTGITRGCNPPDNDRFCPHRSITRGQFAAMMRRGLDLPPGPDAFGDDDGSVFESDIDALAAAGIAIGCDPPGNHRFCPTDPVTRAQMASFLDRSLDALPAGHPRFVDVGGSVHAPAIGALAASGITRGCNPPDNDRFCPTDPVTRGQMAAFLHRADL